MDGAYDSRAGRGASGSHRPHAVDSVEVPLRPEARDRSRMVRRRAKVARSPSFSKVRFSADDVDQATHGDSCFSGQGAGTRWRPGYREIRGGYECVHLPSPLDFGRLARQRQCSHPAEMMAAGCSCRCQRPNGLLKWKMAAVNRSASRVDCHSCRARARTRSSEPQRRLGGWTVLEALCEVERRR